MSVAADFLAALGAKIEASVPLYAGKIRYEYYGMSNMAVASATLPWINLLWLTDSVKPLSNGLNALAECRPQIQIDAYLSADNGFDLATKEAALNISSALRVALFELYYSRTVANWTDLGSVQIEMARVDLPDMAYYNVSIRPEIQLKMDFNEL